MTDKYMKKMLNITHYQRNSNQNHNEVPPHTSENGHHQKKNLQITNTTEDVEKKEPSNTVSGNVNWYSHYGKLYGSFLRN